MQQNKEMTDKVRAAMEDRALYLAMIYRTLKKALPAEQAEKLAREAIYEYGQLKGRRDSEPVTPEAWVDKHVSKGSAIIFESRIVKEADQCQQQMTYCPLLEAWLKLGCSPEEQDLLCDIAMEVDRGRADFHGLPIEIPQRMGKGDEYCCLVIKNK